MRRLHSGIASVARINGIDCVKNRDVNDSHGAAGPPWPELLAKDAGVAWSDRRMIETSCIDRDLVPTMDGIARHMRERKRRHGLGSIEKRPESVAEVLILSAGYGHERREGEK